MLLPQCVPVLSKKMIKHHQLSYRWPEKSIKLEKIYLLFPLRFFKFLAKILKEFISNQNNVLSYGPTHVSYCENFWIGSNLKTWKKWPYFKLKFNYARVGIQQNPFSSNPFGKFRLGNWLYFPLNSIFVETRRCLDQGTEKTKCHVSCL